MQKSRCLGCIKHVGFYYAYFIIVLYFNYWNRLKRGLNLTFYSYFARLFLMQTLKFLYVLLSLKLLDFCVFLSELLNVTLWNMTLFLWLSWQFDWFVYFGLLLNFLLNFGNYPIIILFLRQNFCHLFRFCLKSKFFSLIEGLLSLF